MKYIKFYKNDPEFHDEFLKLGRTKNFRLIDIADNKSSDDYLIFSCDGDENEIYQLNIHLRFEIFYS